MGCTEAQWLGWLPAALGEHAWQRDGARVEVRIGPGFLRIAWQPAPPRLVHLVLVNGRYIEPEKRLSTTLAEGDVLAIWPPIAGG